MTHADTTAAAAAAADITAALAEWIEADPERTATTYARRLTEAARIFEICGEYHRGRGDHITADKYAGNGIMRNLANGLTDGWKTREDAITSLKDMSERRRPTHNTTTAADTPQATPGTTPEPAPRYEAPITGPRYEVPLAGPRLEW